jgi:hypothetical protein
MAISSKFCRWRCLDDSDRNSGSCETVVVVRQLGKSYLNPEFELRDARAVMTWLYDEESEYIFLLRPFIEANRKPVTPTDYEELQFNVPHFHINPHYGMIKHCGYKCLINEEGRQGRSVESWWFQHDEMVSGLNISKDVEEWWEVGVDWLSRHLYTSHRVC